MHPPPPEDCQDFRPRSSSRTPAYDPQALDCIRHHSKSSNWWTADPRLNVFQGLQETVACLCTVVQHLTLEFKRLVTLLRSCSCKQPTHYIRTLDSSLFVARLLALGKIPAERIPPQDIRALPVLILIVALLCEHCNFDRLRTDTSPAPEETLQDIRTELGTLTQVSEICGYANIIFTTSSGPCE